MAVDTSPAVKVEAPPLKAIAVDSRLAPAPQRAPTYAVTVKSSTGKELVVGCPSATRALVALMDVHAVNGGAACHWGGPSAYAEIMSALHGIMFASGSAWYDHFNFVNDAGHAENGIYALRANYGFDNTTFEDLKHFRSIKSKLTGHGESHLNPEGVLLSNGPLGSALPQAQGLAIADKVSGNSRVTVCVVSDGAAMEGEAKEAFAAIPGLAAKGRVNPFVMILSDNDTKLSGRITKDSFSMQPTFAAMATLGWNVISVPHGHNLAEVLHALERGISEAQSHPEKPVALHVKTIKGYGVKSTVESSSGGHGFPLANGEKIVEFVNEIYGGATSVPAQLAAWAQELRADWEKKEAAKKAAPAPAAPTTPAVKKDKVQAGLAQGAVKAAQAGYPVYSISSDVQGSTGISPFQKSFPERFIEVGIAESNMISTGAGFAKAGYIPIVDTFGQFGVTKGKLPITMAALSQAPIIAIFSHVGFQDAADGASHQATTYYAAMSAIPHTTVISPSCADEAESLMFQAIEHYAADLKAGKQGENYIFFVGRESYPVSWIEGARYPWGKAQVLREGSDVTIVGTGPLLNAALQAGKKLADQGISATVINAPFINKVDVETIGAAVKKSNGKLITIEDHQAVCGMGAQISHALSSAGISHVVKSHGIHGEFGQSAYLASELYAKHHLSADDLVASARALLGR
jgi:transketolase